MISLNHKLFTIKINVKPFYCPNYCQTFFLNGSVSPFSWKQFLTCICHWKYRLLDENNICLKLKIYELGHLIYFIFLP